VEGEDEKAAEEKISLPFQPSSYVLSFLFSISKEIHRIGSHTIEKTVLQYLVYELSEKVISIYSSLQTDKKVVKNKEGLIQLLIDTKFIFDVLSGRKEIDNKELKELSNVITMIRGTKPIELEEIDQDTQWTNRVNKLIDSLENELDPIDVAFYQPHLKQCLQKCYKRTVLLLGSLVQFNKIQTNVRQKSSVQEQYIVLVSAPLVTRFSLLPISTPTMRSSSQSSLGVEDKNNQSIQNREPLYPNSASPLELDNNNDRTSSSQSFVDKLGSMFVGEKKQEKGKEGLQNLWFL